MRNIVKNYNFQKLMKVRMIEKNRTKIKKQKEKNCDIKKNYVKMK